MNFLIRTAVALAALQLALPSQATTFNLNLTGSVGDAVESSWYNPGIFGGPPSLNTNWALGLDGLSAANSFAVVQGDIIQVTISLDRSFTFPAPAVSYQGATLRLTGTTSPSAFGAVITAFDFSFLDAGTVVFAQS
jgi:hypothetical protein